MSVKNERLAELTADIVLMGEGLPKFEERSPPLTERQAFLFKLRSSPSDVDLLTFADYLEERDEYNRARLIRVMVDVANRVWDHGGLDLKTMNVMDWHEEVERRKRLKRSLKAEQKALQESLVKGWFPGVAVKGVTATVRKGVVVGIDMPFKAWEMVGDDLYATELPPQVHLTNHPEPSQLRLDEYHRQYPLVQFRLSGSGFPELRPWTGGEVPLLIRESSRQILTPRARKGK